jgi:hypothetical protein
MVDGSSIERFRQHERREPMARADSVEFIKEESTNSRG